MGPLASIAAAVGTNLIGGLMGSGKSKSEETLDLQRLVTDAQAAGFNPLTVLQATGGRGFGSQVSSTDLDLGAIAAGAVMQGLGDYWSQEQARELTDAQIDLTRAQTASIQAGPFGAPVRDVSGTVSTTAKNPKDALDTSAFVLGTTATTAFGDTANPEDVSLEAIRALNKDLGVKAAYSVFGLPWWYPSGEHIEAVVGDGIISTAMEVMTAPLLVGHVGSNFGSMTRYGSRWRPAKTNEEFNQSNVWLRKPEEELLPNRLDAAGWKKVPFFSHGAKQ